MGRSSSMTTIWGGGAELMQRRREAIIHESAKAHVQNRVKIRPPLHAASRPGAAEISRDRIRLGELRQKVPYPTGRPELKSPVSFQRFRARTVRRGRTHAPQSY